MRLKRLETVGFKSFAKTSVLDFTSVISAVVGPNGSGKSNIVEAVRFVLGEQSVKSMRGKRGEDLIFNGSEKLGRLNHAKVKIIFDNSDKAFNIDFDEVIIAREVFRDNSNIYSINGSQVRLKDIIELLASVHIGASSHHIIAQGEADRILNASLKDRREMIEDALGLKIYHWKISESERKLEKTFANIKEAESIRREITPHLRYLKKQVDKIEQAKKLKHELIQMYYEFFKLEDVFIKTENERILNIEIRLQREKELLESEITDKEEKCSVVGKTGSKYEDEINKTKEDLNIITQNKNRLTHEIGKIEGVIEYELNKQKVKIDNAVPIKTSQKIALVDVENTFADVKKIIKKSQVESNLGFIQSLLSEALFVIEKFVSKYKEAEEEQSENTSDITVEIEEKKIVLQQLKENQEKLNLKGQELIKQLDLIQKKEDEDFVEIRKSEKELYERKTELSQLFTRIEIIRSDRARYNIIQSRFDEELEEAKGFIGEIVNEYKSFEVVKEDYENSSHFEWQEKRLRDIEKVKIRVEDVGGGSGGDILKEHDEVKNRDEFLSRELSDLKNTATSLSDLIKELQEKLDNDFKDGIEKINKQFQKFFELMFGGGEASMNLVNIKKKKAVDTESDLGEGFGTDETGEVASNAIESENEHNLGIDLVVSLPNKKIKSLIMLSGGERALTSIALLFAMSRVNPPPFMVLDETDAALDEANSRKYGDMLEGLAETSQLIVITHNRETMSRAGVLYGITMGSDAVSRLLSVNLEEAVEVAK